MNRLVRRGVRWLLAALIIAAVFGGLMRSAAGAIAAGTPVGSGGSGITTVSWSQTIASGSNRLLLVRVVNINSNVTVSSVTYGGVGLTQLATAVSHSSTTAVRASLYYLVAPAVGTASVVVNFSASTRTIAGSLDFTGVSQSTPFGTVATAAGNSNAPSVTVAGASTDMFHDVVAAQGTAGTSISAGSGQTPSYSYTGQTSGDVVGMASVKAGSASSAMTWSLGNSAPWVSIGVPLRAAGLTISGTVFEDVNYGGGAGRTLAASSGAGVSGATVELYNSGGSYVSSTTTASDGSYSFNGLAAGTYYVRVVGNGVLSTRAGSTASLDGVLTYRTNASSGSAVPVTDHVGGTNPAQVDPGAASSGAAFNTSTFAYSAGLSGTAQAVAPVAVSASNITGVDFGFNFDTVVNTNDSGAGSLRQAITNANTLGGDASLAQSGRTAAIENIVFMISNGSAGSGLRSAYNYFTTSAGSYNVATITAASAFPTLSAPLVIDAQTQAGWALEPLVEINGNSLTTTLFRFSAGNSILRGFVINRLATNSNSAVRLDTAGGNTVQGNWFGPDASGSTATTSPRVQYQVELYSGSNTIGGSTASARNVIGNTQSNGIVVWSGSGNVIQGNYIGTNAAGTAALGNRDSGIVLPGASTATGTIIGGVNAGEGNVISGNSGITATTGGIAIQGTGTTGTVIRGNKIGLNAAGSATIASGGYGIYTLSAGTTVGGTAAGAGNTITGYSLDGVAVVGSSATGVAIQGNSIYGNSGIGIDLADNGATANDGAKTANQPNLLMDSPVLTAAALSGGSTLTVAGYVGSAANQSTFASSRVEIFKSDASSANGSGQTYLGYLTADASGNFSGSLSVSGLSVGDAVTATATDTSNNTSEFGANRTVAGAYAVSGTVFEDANYGGGAGRSLAASGGSTANGATVEIYNSSGTYVSSTTTSGAGAYNFTGLTAGTYYVRVVNSTVASQRSGTTAALRGVMTYRTNASSGTAVAVIDHVGGTNPALVDPGAASSGAAFNTSSGVFGAGLSGTAQSFSIVTISSASISGVDFGFNFDTVVNTNDSGQGSLRQAITNANTLGGDASLAQSGRGAAIENLVFMVSNGTTAAGLRSTNNYFSGGVATIAPASALPTLSTSMVIDAQTQPGWTANPVLELNGTSMGGVCLTLSAGSVTLRGWVVNRCPGDAVNITGGSAHVLQGNWIGLNNTGTAASAASASTSKGIALASTGGVLIGGTGASQRNVISGNTYAGIYIGGSTTTLSVTGNYIGTNAAGTAAVANAVGGIRWASGVSGTSGIAVGGTAAGQGNVISGNTGIGVRVTEGAPTISGNIIGLNAAGTAALPNSANGIELLTNVNGATIGGTTAAARNVISGNGGAGISATGGTVTNLVVRGNAIGADLAGTALVANGGNGIDVQVGSTIAIGGTPAGSANVIAGNGGRGVNVQGSASGISILSNSIYSNSGIGIDLGNDGATANDGAKTSGQPNLLMDTPVFTSASLSGGTLTLAGYVGSAANQSTFASARVEVFTSDNSSSNGQGRTYLGYLTADASGNFSGSIAVSGVTSSDTITATATDGSGNTSEFAANRSLGVTVSGTVFEDLNYGGGAGRSLAASSGTGVAGARVELYDNSGVFVSAATTAAGGAYSFTGVGSGAYTVRVVNSTVLSTRSGATASQVGVQTYRTEAASGTAAAVTDHVGGLDPANADAAAGAGGTTLWNWCANENGTCSFSGTKIVRYGNYGAGSSRWTTRVLTGGTSCSNAVFGDPYAGYGKLCQVFNASYQSVANVAVASAAVTGIDFGFNFSTIVNTNDSGQGSLRQFVTNANALGGKASLAQSGNRRDLSNAAQALPAATETSIFMIAGGSAVAGLRSTVPSQLTSGVAQVVLTSTLPSIAAAGVSLDGSTQTANVGDTNAGLLGGGGTVGTDALTLAQVAKPEVELTFASLASGVTIAANNATVRGLALRATGAAPLGNGAVALNNDVTGAVIEGNVIGTRATALTDPGAGLYIGSGVISNGADSGVVRNNLIAYFTTTGVQLAGTLSATWTISGNEIRDGGLDFNNTDGIALSSATAVTISGNRITGMSTQGIVFGAGAGSGTQIVNNTLSGNGVGPANAASIQSNVVVARSGASGVRVEANVISANYGAGIAVNSGATGIALTRNLVYGNGTVLSRNGSAATGQIDIDLNSATDNVDLGTAPFVTTNDTGDADSGGNNLQNHPVLTSAILSGGTQLIVAGTLNSNASSYYRIEFFGNSSPNATGRGGAMSYLGFVNAATDGSGNATFGTTLNTTVALGSYVTATAIKSDATYATMSDTSEFAPNVQAGLSLTGKVFEDVNYGGGAGRSLAASGGVALDGARVELYGSGGAFVSATTTAGGGAYRFDVAAAGNYFVRVVGSSVPSSRSGYAASLVGVMTYRANAASGTAIDVTDFVGGTNPALIDPGNGASGTALNTSTYVFTSGLTGTAQAVAPVTVAGASISSIDFGFNFDTVVNTNDSGQGSLRQAITNANTLTGETSLAQSGRTAAIENLVFMLPNGTAGNGLRSSLNAFSAVAGRSAVATVTLASALPQLATPMVLDAQTQPGWGGSDSYPIIEVNAAGGGGTHGVRISSSTGAVTLRGLIVNRASGEGIKVESGASNGDVIQGCWSGINSAGTTSSGFSNSASGISLQGGSNHLVGGSTAAQRNITGGNYFEGISTTTGSGHTISGNYIGVGPNGSSNLGGRRYGILIRGSGGATVTGNVVANQGAAGIYLETGSGNTVQGNIVGADPTGVTAMGNGASPPTGNPGGGIYVTSGSNAIGGTGGGQGNVVRASTGAGVAIVGGVSGNAVLVNSIYGNSGAGIDLGNDGITANDGAKTSGQPNLLMDAPVFTSARARGSALTVAGYIGTAAGQSAFAGSRVEVFISDSTSANGSGKTWLGALTADASGNFSGTVTMPFGAIRAGSVLTGTATDTSNNTSEFGANFSDLVVDWLINDNGDGVDANPGDGLCETSTAGQCTLRAAIMEANAWAGSDLAAFALPNCPGAGCIITPASVLPSVTGQLTIDGQTQPGWTAAPLVDLRGEGAGAGSSGLNVTAAGSIVRGLAVGGFLQSGIVVNANNVTIEGVYAGVAPDGVTARANGAVNSATGGVYVAGGTGVVVGGTTATTRNVLSGNGGSGLWINGGTVTAIGNYIGTNSSGSSALRNRRWGVQVAFGSGHQIGGAAAGQGNVISGNTGGSTGGIVVGTSNVTIQGNTIGLTAARTAAIPNGDGSDTYSSGIDLRSGSTGILVGGLNAGEGNVISGNVGHGVRVQSQTTRILGNSIYNNLWLGIDLGANGVTANNGTQSGALPNSDMDYPVITSAGYDPATRALTLTGYVGTGTGQALFAGARVELFTSDGDATGYGEGSAFVGSLTADANGRFSGTVSVPASVSFAVGTALTGTATDTAGNTSEFGPNYVTTTMSALAPSRFNAFETSTAAGALTGVIQTRVAGAAGSIAVIAIDNTGSALQTSFAGTVALEWMNATDNSGALDAGNCRASWVASGSAGSTTFVSGDQGRRNATVTPATVGREWRLRMSYAGPGGTVTSCSTDAFAVRPDLLAITGVTDADDSTAGTTRALDNLLASGGRVHRAGRPFSLRAAARDAANAVAAGYTGTPTLAITGCVLPAGCTAGTLTAPALVASAGLIAADTLSYSEVGAINLQLTDDSFADIDAADTPLSQRRIQSSVLGVGRFVPDRYLLSAATTPLFATQQGACAATGQGFTFVGQNFGWATAPSFTVTAQNAAGATTTLWGGSLQKLSTAHIARSLAASNAQGLTPAVSWGSMALSDAGGGRAGVALSGDQFLFTRNAAAPVASFVPLITLGIAVSDVSEVAVSGNSAVASTVALVIGGGTGIGFNQGSNFHYARLKLQNAFGDVRRGVRANVELQKYTDRGWLRLNEDNSCITVPQPSIAFGTGSGAFAADLCTAPASASVALRQGRGTLVLPKTAGNVQGAALVTLNIGAVLEGNACASGLPVTPTSAAWPHLLGARGSGSTQDQNPAARLVWGRQHRDYLVQRELF
jgi:parallel beta-helix repeat protein